MVPEGILEWIGFLTVIYLLYRLYGFLSMYVIRKPRSLNRYRGKWAVISGASYGIGAEFARQLAAKGINIVLIARSKEKMAEIASSIEKTHKIQTRIISCDFGSTDRSIYSEIEEKTKDIEVAMLVNNVGMAPSGRFCYYEELPAEELDQVVQVNISSQLHLTRIFYPKMIARKFGCIINLSSLSGLESVTSAGLTIYGATKAFNLKLSQNMQEESSMCNYGVEVVCSTPGFVSSPMSRMRVNIMQGVCSEEQNVRDTLNKLGYNYQYFTPWVGHVFSKYVFMISNSPFLIGFKKKIILGRRQKYIWNMQNKKKN